MYPRAPEPYDLAKSLERSSSMSAEGDETKQ